MIKQALNAPSIAEVMSRFAKDDAIKLLGKSTYNKWLKKLPADRIASNLRGRFLDTSSELRMREDRLRVNEANRLQHAQEVANALMDRYGPSFETNLPRVNERLDTRGRLKGAVLEKLPRINYLKNFTTRNSLVSRDELLRWSRAHKAGLDPKTLTSEWYVKPVVDWDEMDTADVLRNPRYKTEKIAYNGKGIPADIEYFKAQLVRNMSTVPYMDPIRHKADQLVANELHKPLKSAVRRRSIYNSVSDNTRKVLNYINGRNVLEDPRALSLIESANKHGRLNINIDPEYKNGTNAAFTPAHNIVAAHPRLTQDIKNHERTHYLLYNMGTQEHADIASRAFRGIDAISRKNPEYSNLSGKLISLPGEAHEAVTDYYRHKLFGTLGSQAADHKSTGALNAELSVAKPMIDHTVSETKNLTSNPGLQQALQQLAISYGVPLRNTEQIPDSVLKRANRAMYLERMKRKLRNFFRLPWVR